MHNQPNGRAGPDRDDRLDLQVAGCDLVSCAGHILLGLFPDHLEETLRRMGELGDIIRLMQRELTTRRLDRSGVEQVVSNDLREPIVGRVIQRGFSDEHHDRHYLMVDGGDDRVHYVDIGPTDATPLVLEGSTVGVARSRIEATQADRTVDAVARANGGRYSIDLHLAHDPGASEAFATSHVRRLEAMRRAGSGLERLADGSWTIADDHLARADAYARAQQRDRPVTLKFLSRSPVDELAGKEAPTLLDRALAEGGNGAVRDAGYGLRLVNLHAREIDHMRDHRQPQIVMQCRDLTCFSSVCRLVADVKMQLT